MMKTRLQNLIDQAPVLASISGQKWLKVRANKGVWLFYIRSLAKQIHRHLLLLLLFAAVCSTISIVAAATFTISADGHEITDHETGLIWQRCAEGMRWNGSHCIGRAREFTFESALVHAQFEAQVRGNTWRLPNLSELLSITDPLRATPAIDVANFPGTPPEKFWTSSTFVRDRIDKSSQALFVDFSQGGYLHHDHAMRHHVRLVRDVQ
jgi:Protein of unknown function (DUF1566)